MLCHRYLGYLLLLLLAVGCCCCSCPFPSVHRIWWPCCNHDYARSRLLVRIYRSTSKRPTDVSIIMIIDNHHALVAYDGWLPRQQTKPTTAKTTIRMHYKMSVYLICTPSWMYIMCVLNGINPLLSTEIQLHYNFILRVCVQIIMDNVYLYIPWHS